MKLRTKIKIAYDMCIKQLFSFRMSTILMAITLTIFGIMIYQYRCVYSFRLKVEEGFKTPLSDVYYILYEDNSGGKIQNALYGGFEGMSPIYSLGIYYNTTESISFLNKVQAGHKLDSDMEGVEEAWLFCRDFDLFNVKVTEGMEPKDIDKSKIKGVPIYLSEKFKDITELYDYYDAGSYDYFLAGYFDESSTVPPENVTNGAVQDGSYSLEYGMVELAGGAMDFRGYFTIDDGYDFDEVKSRIQETFREYNSVCTISNVSQSVKYMEKRAEKGMKYLMTAAILLCGTSIAVLLINQIGNVLTRSREYGIWLVNKAVKSDIIWILVWQNLIRFIYAELLAIIALNLIIRLALFSENFNNNLTSRIISNRIINFNIYPAIIVIGLLIALVSVIAPLIKLSKTEPVKLIKGEI